MDSWTADSAAPVNQRLATRWCLFAAAGTAILLAGALSFSWLVDPYQQFRPHERYVKGAGPQRTIYAATIRHRPEIEAMVIGSSLVANFNPDLAERSFGYKTQVVSLIGGSSREIRETTKYALRHKPKLRAMIIEFSPFAICNDGWSPAARFPTELYDDSVLGLPAYLISGTTLVTSAKMVLNQSLGWFLDDFTDSYAKYVRTYEMTKPGFGNPVTLRQRAAEVGDRRTHYSEDDLRAIGKNLADCFRSRYAEIIEGNPSVQFYFISNPIFQWGLLQFEMRGIYRMYDVLTVFADRWPNVQFHDFVAPERIVVDCSHFLDVYHYDPYVSDFILEKIKSGEFRRTTAMNARLNEAAQRLMGPPVPCPAPGS